jgi:hypothetical protein
MGALSSFAGGGAFFNESNVCSPRKKNAQMALKKKPPSRRRLNKNEIFGKI